MFTEQTWKESKILLFSLVAAGAGAFIGTHVSAANAPVAAAAPNITTAAGMESSFAPVVDRALPAVVNISSSKARKAENPQSQMDPFFRQFFGRDFAPNVPPQRRERSLGSGVIVRADGYLLTNNHVIDGATDISVTMNDKRELKAKLVGTDPKTDIAVLKVEASNLPTVPMADNGNAKVGDIVLAMGNPFGLGQTVTMGIIGAKGRTNLGIEDYEDFLQTDAPINPGNSGGALINARGELIGINTAILANNGGNQGVGFAVPVALARSVMNQVMEHGKVVRGYLGIVPQDVTPALAKALQLPKASGVVIGDVTPDGPAAKAGVERGDVVLELNGVKLEDANQLRMKVSMTPPGTNVDMKTLRNGTEKMIAVKLGELPGTNEGKSERSSDKGSSGAIDGVSVDTLNAQMLRNMRLPSGTQGVVITDVESGSAAQVAGLREGDVIQEVNRIAVNSAPDFDRAVRNAGSGTVLLLVNRNGLTQYVAIQGK
ncbi:MAG: DegQ family serine endoprotease [Bryobacteraceae bacterium]